MGNGFAYLVLLAWPLLAIWLYRNKNIQLATLLTIVGGYMILPVGTSVDLPFIPPFGKHSMPVLSALLGCWLIKKQPIKYFSNKGLTQVLVVLLFVGTFVTANLNSDSFVVGGRVLPGLTLHDAISAVIGVFLEITPFFIGKQFFRTYKQQLLMFKFLVVAGLLYSIPMLFEIRMSPQLHTWIYGYFPHSFAQQARDGGFRPVVFMGHGLWVAFFSACVVLAAVTLFMVREKIGKFKLLIPSYYLLIVLILCKSKAALLYGLFAFFIIKKASYKTQIRAAILLMAITLLYPTMSIIDVFPHEKILEISSSLMGEERTGSLRFRFDNEEILLNHAREKFFFGWGGWGRNRIYDETGADISVTDGRWIATFGVSGFVGFIAQFGLLGISILSARKGLKVLKGKQEKSVLVSHALLVGVIMIDQLPNASLAPWLWLLAGVLLGRSEQILVDNKFNKDRNVQ